MKATYLLINFLTILFPLLLSFDKRIQFYKCWKYVFPGLFLTGLLFLVWDYVFTVYQVWYFNPHYIIGFYILNLPLEEIMFFLTVPFACIFIYECLNYYIKKDLFRPVSKYLSLILIALSLVFLFLFYDRVYTLVTFGLLAVVVFCAEFILKSPFLSRFYLAYLVSMIPFYIVNGILTSIPVVMYNDTENMGFRIGSIPFEDHFYSMSMLLINVLLFEYFRKRGEAIS